MIIFTRWGRAKQASAVASVFIVLNSISGLVGRISVGSFFINGFSLSLVPFGVAGSNFGAQRLSGIHIRCALVDKNSSITGTQNIGLTTNSILVEKMAPSLVQAGLLPIKLISSESYFPIPTETLCPINHWR
ncbi:MAG: hypothetical protein WA109_05630 [Bellilinea sp.]